MRLGGVAFVKRSPQRCSCSSLPSDDPSFCTVLRLMEDELAFQSIQVTASSVRALRDFTLSLPVDYRKGYANWRRGEAHGARGEPTQPRTLKTLPQPTPEDPWVENLSPERRRPATKAPTPPLMPLSARASDALARCDSPSCGPTPADPWDEAPFSIGAASIKTKVSATSMIQSTPTSSTTCSPRE